MKNWSTNTKKLRQNKAEFTVWRIEQLINFGLGKEKLKLTELKKYWKVIDIDPLKRKFLALFVN
jgi:hypothetical protein